MRGKQLHPSRAPGEPQSGFPGTVQVQFLDKVVDVPAVVVECVYKLVAVPAAQVSPVPPAPVVETVVSHSAIVEKSSISFELFFDKVADMPVGVCCSTLTRWWSPCCTGRAVFKVPGVRRQSYPTVADHWENRWDPSCSTWSMVDVPVAAGRAWFPVQVVVPARVVEKLVEIPEIRAAGRDSAENCRGSASAPRPGVSLGGRRWRLGGEWGALDDEEFFVVEGWLKPLREASKSVS